MANRIGNIIVGEMRKGMQQVEISILAEFRKYTPGFSGIHQRGPDVEEHKHPLPKTRDAFYGKTKAPYSQDLAHGWRFVRNPGGYRSVGGVINIKPYAGYVDYGYFTRGWSGPAQKGVRGKRERYKGVHVPGHYMVQQALKYGRVRELYAVVCKRTLVISLAQIRLTGAQGAKYKASRAADLRPVRPGFVGPALYVEGQMMAMEARPYSFPGGGARVGIRYGGPGQRHGAGSHITAEIEELITSPAKMSKFGFQGVKLDWKLGRVKAAGGTGIGVKHSDLVRVSLNLGTQIVNELNRVSGNR